MNNIYVVDVRWLYNVEFDKYRVIFDIIPREVILNFLYTMPDIPGIDETFYDFFTIMYSFKYDTIKGADRYFSDLDEIAELIALNLERRFSLNNNFVILAWLDKSSIIVTDIVTNRKLTLSQSFDKKYYNRCFRDMDILKGMEVGNNLSFYHKLIIKPEL